MIPFFNIKQQNQEVSQEILSKFTEIVDSCAFIQGVEVKSFEEEFSTAFQVKHAIACASGSDALLISLMAAAVGPGDEVLVPSFTFLATATCVSRLGAKPVFVDSDDTYNLCLQDVEKKINSKTKAIVPVHLFGQMLDMERLNYICSSQTQEVFVLEDAAQSIGAKFNGRYCGNYGNAAAYSFYPTKNLGAMGDAGLITTNDDSLAEKIRMLCNHGESKRYYHDYLGVNSRMDSMQAAVLRVKLKKLAQYEQKRIRNAQKYFDLIQNTKLEEFLLLPKSSSGSHHVWNQFTVRVKRRDELFSFLREKNIGCAIYYPMPLHKQKCFGGVNSDVVLPKVEQLCEEVLSLPIYPECEPNFIEQTVATISDFYSK